MVLTRGDLKQVRLVVAEELDEKLTELKGEFYERIDPILKEVQTAREERPLIENRLEALEEIHPGGKHPSLSQ